MGVTSPRKNALTHAPHVRAVNCTIYGYSRILHGGIRVQTVLYVSHTYILRPFDGMVW